MPPLPRLHTPAIADLYEQLRFAPREAIGRDIERAEALAEEIDPEISYPADWIVFRVTGYRPDMDSPDLVQGEALLTDLSTLVERLSDSVSLSAESIEGAVGVDALCERWSVSRKTLDRYRKRGLVARRVRDGGGRTVLVFSRRAIEAFERRSGEMLRGAGGFTRMSEEESERVIARARRYRAVGLTLNDAALRLSRRCGRSHEAVRQLLRRHDRQAERPIFGAVQRPADRRKAIVLRASRLGVTPSEMARKYGRSRGSVTRMLIEARAHRLEALTLSVGAPDAGALDAEEARMGLAPAPAEDLLDLVERARGASPPGAAMERALGLARVALERTASRSIGAFGSATTARAVDEVETLLRWESRLRARLVEQQMGVMLRTIEDRLGQAVDRVPGRQLVELMSLAIAASAQGVAGFDPARGGRLAAPVGLSVSRAVQGWMRAYPGLARPAGGVGRATARPTRGRSAGWWSLRVSPWQAFLEADPRVRDRLDLLEGTLKELIMLRYGLGGERPLTFQEAGDRLDVSAGRAVSMERSAIRSALRTGPR